MWFKQVRFYQVSEHLSLTESQWQAALAQFPARPCGQLETQTMGFARALNHPELYSQVVDNCRIFSLQINTKILPTTVINAELQDELARREAQGEQLSKQAQKELKEEITDRLLPKAFSKSQRIDAVYLPQTDLLMVAAGSSTAAENVLAMLRKAIGSLPALPLAKTTLAPMLTEWLSQAPEPPLTLGHEFDFQDLSDDGAVVKVKNLPLDAPEVQLQLDEQRLMVKSAIHFAEHFTAILDHEGCLKRIKYSEEMAETNALLRKDDQLAGALADASLCIDSLQQFALYLRAQL